MRIWRDSDNTEEDTEEEVDSELELLKAKLEFQNEMIVKLVGENDKLRERLDKANDFVQAVVMELIQKQASIAAPKLVEPGMAKSIQNFYARKAAEEKEKDKKLPG